MVEIKRPPIGTFAHGRQYFISEKVACQNDHLVSTGNHAASAQPLPTARRPGDLLHPVLGHFAVTRPVTRFLYNNTSECAATRVMVAGGSAVARRKGRGRLTSGRARRNMNRSVSPRKGLLMYESLDPRNTDQPKRQPAPESDAKLIAALLQDAKEHVAKRQGQPRRPRGVCLTCLLSDSSEPSALPVEPSLATRIVRLIKRIIGTPFNRP